MEVLFRNNRNGRADRLDPASNPAGEPPLFSGRFVLLLLVQLPFGFGFSTFFILPKFMAVELATDAGTIGQVTAMFGLVGVCATPIVGAQIDRFGRKRFVALGTALMALSAVAFLLVDRIGPLLYLLRGLQGVAFTFGFNALATLVTDLAPPARLGRALGVFGAAMLVTNGLAPNLLEPVAASSGWASVFLCSALASAVAFVLSFALVEPGCREERAPGATEPVALPLRRLAPILVAATMAGSAFGTILTFYQPFALSLGIDRVSGFFLGFTAAALCARIFLGGLADRFGRLKISVVALVLYGSAAVAVAGLRPGMLEALGVALGLAHGLFYPALNALAVSVAPRGARGRVMSFFSGAFTAGHAMSVWLLSLVVGHTGYPTVFIAAGLLVHAAATLLAFSRVDLPWSASTDAASGPVPAAVGDCHGGGPGYR